MLHSIFQSKLYRISFPLPLKIQCCNERHPKRHNISSYCKTTRYIIPPYRISNRNNTTKKKHQKGQKGDKRFIKPFDDKYAPAKYIFISWCYTTQVFQLSVEFLRNPIEPLGFFQRPFLQMALPVMEKCVSRDWRMGPSRTVEMRLVLARPDICIRSTKRTVRRFGNDVNPVRVFNSELEKVKNRTECNLCLDHVPE